MRLALILATVAFAGTSHAQLYFDGSDTSTANGASGITSGTSPHTWNTATANWDNGAGYVTWTNGANAVITGSGGSNKTINLANSITVGALTWSNTAGTMFMSTANGSAMTINGGINFNNPAGVNWSVPITLGGSQTWSMGGTNSTGKSITGGTNLNGHTLTWDTSGTSTNLNSHPVHSDITGSGSIIKNGVGYVRLQGTNSYNGSTTINNGTLFTESSSALGNVNNQLTVNTGGTLNMSSQSLTVGNLTGTGGLITGSSGTRTLTIGSGDNGGGSFQGVIEDGSGGTSALTKIGTGTISLSGSNTYSGDTQINNGTLLINNATGSGTGSGAVTVGLAGTLGGIGTVGGATTVNGALNPGASPGVLSFSNSLSLTASSTTTFEIDGVNRGSQYDGINVASSLALGGDLVFDLGSVIASDATFDLFDVTGATSGNFANVSLTGVMGSGAFSFDSVDAWSLTDGTNSWSFSQSAGQLSLTIIPEPSTALFAGLGLLALLRRRCDA